MRLIIPSSTVTSHIFCWVLKIKSKFKPAHFEANKSLISFRNSFCRVQVASIKDETETNFLFVQSNRRVDLASKRSVVRSPDKSCENIYDL